MADGYLWHALGPMDNALCIASPPVSRGVRRLFRESRDTGWLEALLHSLALRCPHSAWALQQMSKARASYWMMAQSDSSLSLSLFLQQGLWWLVVCRVRQVHLHFQCIEQLDLWHRSFMSVNVHLKFYPISLSSFLLPVFLPLSFLHLSLSLFISIAYK